ncbi:PQQ-dependent sugar dehydrogenase [Aquincola sp. MAHUQ-54]|uniref:PQQ-dependent sugar dehydrogenase n=1 Tax=Aquincola agrisoli TaxID=3119538 RepID=A0AAW9QF08_9BURK
MNARHALTLGLGAIVASQAFAEPYLPAITRGSIAVTLETVASGLGAPNYAISAPGDAGRLFIVDQAGALRVLHNGALLAGPALDLQGLIGTSYNPASANDERGFLGLAFHPGYNDAASAGYRTLYTYSSSPLDTAPTYAAPNGATQGYKNVVNEWKMSAADPAVVDPGSRREVISFGKNANNHNGGTIAFGPDGYLYLGLGDGGNRNDVGPAHLEPGGNAQNLGTPMGKMLRIDPLSPALTAGSANAVAANGQYRIPADNPFQAAGQVAETFAYGLRNPYRFSFDTLNGQLIAADVGQNNIEEINRIVKGGNYGWAVKEGDFVFDRATGAIGPRTPGDPAGLIDPIRGTLGTLEYDHGDGISITGGFVYRGGDIPELYGKYVFGDLALRSGPRADGRLFYADLDTGVIHEFLLPQFSAGVLPDGLTVHGFGQDAEGELYVLVTNTPANGIGGLVYRVAAVPEPGTWALMGLGLAVVGGLAARRRRDPGRATVRRGLVLAALAGAAGAQAAVAYDEAVDGDLSNSGLAPTAVTFALGANDVRGSSGITTPGDAWLDYGRFVVPAGALLTRIEVLAGTAGAEGGALFFGLQAGAQVTVSPGPYAGQEALLGWNHFSANDVGSTLLGPQLPLAAGSYAFWIQDFDFEAAPYALRFTVAAVPEPPAWMTALAGLAALALTARRRRVR